MIIPFSVFVEEWRSRQLEIMFLFFLELVLFDLSYFPGGLKINFLVINLVCTKAA